METFGTDYAQAAVGVANLNSHLAKISSDLPNQYLESELLKVKMNHLILVPHVILLFLVAGEDSDFRYVNYCLLICISIASGLSDAKVSASLTTRAR